MCVRVPPRQRVDRLASMGIDEREEAEREEGLPALSPPSHASGESQRAVSVPKVSPFPDPTSRFVPPATVGDMINAALMTPGSLEPLTPSIETSFEILRAREASLLSMSDGEGGGSIEPAGPPVIESQRPSPPLGCVVTLTHVMLLNLLRTLESMDTPVIGSSIGGASGPISAPKGPPPEAQVAHLASILRSLQVAVPVGFEGPILPFPNGRTESLCTLLLAVILAGAGTTAAQKFPGQRSVSEALWDLACEVLNAGNLHVVIGPDVSHMFCIAFLCVLCIS